MGSQVKARPSGKRIALILEGETERVFLPHLRAFLQIHLSEKMPSIRAVTGVRGRIPKGKQLKTMVANLLKDRHRPADFVVALTDVYTGTRPFDFKDAKDAKFKMKEWVGSEIRFFPHAAQYEFEAWLIPYWPALQKMAGHDKSAPSGSPESVNHDKPPSKWIKELFEIGTRGKSYSKQRDAEGVLRNNDLSIAISQCPELKSFINTILTICGATPIP